MNFKSLAISAVVALSSIVPVGSAQAAATTCAYRDATDLYEFACDRTVRVNANGHNVNDVTFFINGKRFDQSIIWWLNERWQSCLCRSIC